MMNRAKSLFSMGKETSDIISGCVPMNWDFFIEKNVYIEFYVRTLYKKILRYLFRKTIFDNKIKEKLNIFQDNFLNTEQNLGFISLLANAICQCETTVLRYDPKTNAIERINKQDNINPRDVNVCAVDFSKNKAEILLLSQYASMLYDLLESEQKKTKVSNSITFKVGDLTAKVGTLEKGSVEKQAKNIKDAINNGDMAVIDAESSIEMGTTDLRSEAKTEETIKQNIAEAIGLPLNFLFGANTAGIGASGENDTDSLERAMQTNFEIYWRPYVEKLFDTKIKYKAENWQLIRNCRDILDYVETSALLTEEQKQTIAGDILESIGYGKEIKS
jgi:hypothetical protein